MILSKLLAKAVCIGAGCERSPRLLWELVSVTVKYHLVSSWLIAAFWKEGCFTLL